MGLRGIVQMLTIIHLMKATDGSPITMIPKTELLVRTTEECEGEDKLLLTEDHSPIEDILTYEWVYSTRNVSSGTTKIILCQKTSGGFAVNPSYHGKVEYCDASGIQLKNVSLNDLGYYKLQFLREKTEHKESQTIFLRVSATPTEQCKPAIINHSGNELHCTTHCGYLDLQWIWNKTESVVGNESVLPVSCSWKNEVILCCPKGQAMGCYKGSQHDLCTPTTPSSCIESTPGDDGFDIHAVKAPDRSDSNLLGLLTLVIIPVILAIFLIFYRNKIKSKITICHSRKSKPTRTCHMNTQAEAVHLLEVKVESESSHTIDMKAEPESTSTVEMKAEPESTSTVKMKAEPESTSAVEMKAEPESTSAVEMKAEPESTCTVKMKVELESISTVEVKKPESMPTVKVKEEPESTLNIKEKEKLESTPTVDMKEESGCTPTQFCEPEQKIQEKTTEDQASTDSEIMRELEELRHAELCKICLAKKMSVAFRPCGHLATCANCSIALQLCPVCRALIQEKMNICFG